MTSKFALVIANTEYQDESFAKLTAPGKDAEEFAQVLRELATFDDVQVLINESEGRTRRLIARFFAERKRDDLLLLYFSGHGVRNEQGQLFLAANDTEINILEASGIPADFVTQSMNNSRSQRQLLILDCCNSGAFAHGSKSAVGIGKSMGIAIAFEGSGFGRVVLTATDATQYAWEGDKVIGDTQKSVFTHFLIEGLKGEADRNGDGRIDVDELYDYAYDQVVRRTPKQTPGKWSYKQQGDIILRENLQPRDVKPAPLPAELLEMLSHLNSGVRRAGILELISLLEEKHLGLVRAAEEKLREIVVNDDSLTLRKYVSDTLVARGLKIEQSAPVLNQIPEEEHKEEKKIGKSSIVQPRYLPEQKKISPKFNPRLIGGVTVILLVGIFLVLANSAIANKWFASNSTTTATEDADFVAALTSAAETITAQSTINTPSPIQTSIPATPEFSIGSTMKGKDDMTLLYVPAGEFIMGNDADDTLAECQKFRSDCQRSWFIDEELPHSVHVDAFWMDKTEVTVRMYYLCVETGMCKEPTNKTSATHSSYYGNSEFDNYPVIYIDWDMARTYCEWTGRRLPNEAEWEKAARGPDGNIYPWGNTFDGTLVNFCDKNCSLGWANKSFDDKFVDVAPVGSYISGKSIYGVVDMVGNVGEWVADWYGDTYYHYFVSTNPAGPSSGTYRVSRGNSWYGYGIDVTSVVRYKDYPNTSNSSLGFRCAMDTTP